MRFLKQFWDMYFLFGLALVPFGYFIQNDAGYEVVKANLIVMWVLGLLFLSILRANKKWIYNRKILGAVVWLLASMLVSSIFGESMKRSVWGNYWRGDGLVVYGSLFMMAMLLSKFMNKELMAKIRIVLTSTTVILGIWSLVVQVFGVFMLGTFKWMDGGLGLSFGNPNFLAGYMLMGLPLIHRLKTKFRYVFFGLVFVGIYGTGAWLGLLGIFFWIGLECFLKLKSNKSKTVFIVSSLFVMTVAIVSWLSFNSTQSRLGQLPESRDRIARKLIYGWMEKPILGYGWANVDKAFVRVDWPMKFYDDVYLDKAHSMGLEYLVSTGIIGFTAYIWLIFLVGRRLYSNKFKGWWVLLVLYAFHSQTNVISLAEEMVWFVLVGIGLSKKQT